MTIEQTTVVDAASLDENTGELILVIADHLSWEGDESRHLTLLQEKLNSYLRFIESGEVFSKIPEARGRNIAINIVGKFELSYQAGIFYHKASEAIRAAGFDLRFQFFPQNSL